MASRTCSLFDLISELYDDYLACYDEEPLAVLATNVTVTEMLINAAHLAPARRAPPEPEPEHTVEQAA
jgi:hypothetical protein